MTAALHASHRFRWHRYAVPAAITLLHGLILVGVAGSLLRKTPAEHAGAGVVVTVVADTAPPVPQPEPPKPQSRPPAPQSVSPQRASARPVVAARAVDAPATEAAAETETPAVVQQVPPSAATATPQDEAPAALTPPRFDAAYLDNRAPDYPALSRRLGEQGRVVLRVLVAAEGSAREVQIHASSGHARLDEAALAAVKTWRFVPARRGDTPVAEWVRVPIPFVLR